jgi:hypothetical protein
VCRPTIQTCDDWLLFLDTYPTIEPQKLWERSDKSSKCTLLRLFGYKLITKGAWNISEDIDSMWKKITIHIKEVVIEVFRVTKENKYESKDTWWWNENVQKAINEKK